MTFTLDIRTAAERRAGARAALQAKVTARRD
jgi:hypothetical protein